MKKFLLVSEGPTDHVVIKEVAKTISSAVGDSIDIVELSPQRDATSGTYPSHGWGAIKSWCKKYSLKTPELVAHLPRTTQIFLQRQQWRALVAFDKANGLIIQLDTDIAHELTELKTIQPGECRKTHCANEVLSWLNEKGVPDSLHLALTSFALETWILATHPRGDAVFADLPDGFNYEEIENVEDRLIALGYESRLKKGRRRIKKSPYTVYEPYARRIALNLDVVRQNCEAADALCVYIES